MNMIMGWELAAAFQRKFGHQGVFSITLRNDSGVCPLDIINFYNIY